MIQDLGRLRVHIILPIVSERQMYQGIIKKLIIRINYTKIYVLSVLSYTTIRFSRYSSDSF